jgi:hypothetical protein
MLQAGDVVATAQLLSGHLDQLELSNPALAAPIRAQLSDLATSNLCVFGIDGIGF